MKRLTISWRGETVNKDERVWSVEKIASLNLFELSFAVVVLSVKASGIWNMVLIRQIVLLNVLHFSLGCILLELLAAL